MNDVAWSGRLLIWVGAAVLLVESVLGRGLGPLTVFAVLALCCGLPALLVGLAAEGRTVSPAVASPPTLDRDEAVPAAVPEVAPAVDAVPPAVEEPSHRVPPEPAEPVVDPAPPQAVTEAEPAATIAPGPSQRDDRGATTYTVGNDQFQSGLPCLACNAPLVAGQLAAVCSSCGGTHHALCWIGSRFRCSRDGCGGHGALAEPSATIDRPREV